MRKFLQYALRAVVTHTNTFVKFKPCDGHRRTYQLLTTRFIMVTSTSTGKFSKGEVKSNVRCREGARKYRFKLIDLIKVNDFKNAVGIVKNHINATLEDEKRTIETFYIGRTSTKKLKRSESFDHMKKETMNKEHISRRWNYHKGHKKDGMVILTVITRTIATGMRYKDDKTITDTSQERHSKRAEHKTKGSPKCAALKCALDIEKELQEEFQDDPRLEHGKKHHTGPTARNVEAYPLYIAFKYLQPNNSRKDITTAQNSRASYHFHLVDLSKAATLIEAGARIADKISEICNDLKVGTEGKEPKIEIGHTYLSKQEGCAALDPMESKSFNKKGIQEKWALHRKEGKDGMKVIAVVTKELATRLQCKDTKEYIKKIEAKLKDEWILMEEKEEKDTDMCLYFTYTF